jgi:O-antigen/teichoic acid export membrane protein
VAERAAEPNDRREGVTSLPREGAGSKGRRLARNTLFSAVSESSFFLLALLFLLLPRALGPVAFGEYSAAAAFVGLFRILPDFGMSYASTIAISRDRSLAERWAGNLLGFQSLLSLLTVALCLGIGRFLFEGVTFQAIAILTVSLVLSSYKVTLRWLLKSFDRFGAEAFSLVLERTLLLALGVLSLKAGWGMLGFVLVFAVLRIPDTLGLWAWVTARVVPLRLRGERELWGELFWKGLPFAYAGAMILLFFQMDQVLLRLLRGAEEVGWYGAPVKVLEGLTLVPRILAYAFIPTMASLHAASPAEVAGLYRRGSKYLLLVGLPIAAFGYLASDVFIPLLFGPQYLKSVSAAQILLPSCAFMFLSNFGETTLACIDRWKTIVLVSTGSVLLNLVLNLLWIPRYGFLGASWATLWTEAAYFVLTAVSLRILGQRIGWASLAARPALAAAVFALVLWGIRRVLGGHSPVVALCGASAAASAVWLAATFALGVWDRAERDLLRRPAPRNGS